METLKTDVAIIGASIAGATAAALYARAGLKVALIERQPEMSAYKKVCTHFIQAGATPVIKRLGLDKELDAAGAVHNGLQTWTRWGWFRLAMEEREDAQGATHGYSIRREKLDPMLRALAARTEGVELLMDHSLRALLREGGRVSGVEIEGPNGVMKRVEARLVVGADGRSTRTAELAGIAPEVLPHNRGGYQAYFKGLTLATGTDAQFWLMDPDIAYAFPNEGGVVCLATFMAKDKIPEFKKDIEGNFLRYFDGLPDGPDVRRGERIGPIVGVLDLPNMYRVPVLPGLALVGDAALASDPVWGVGCGWAFQSASWLVDHTAAALTSGGDLNAALESYRRLHYERLYAQHKLNAGYSTGGPFDPARKLIFMTAPRDAKVRRYLGLIGAERLSQRGGGLRLLSRALWVRATLFARPKAAEKPRFISG